jgi:hypothetical protein
MAILVEFDYIFKAAVSTVVGYIVWKFKKVEEKADESLNEQEIRQIIDDKTEPMKVMQAEIKEDLNRIEGKLDRLVERR